MKSALLALFCLIVVSGCVSHGQHRPTEGNASLEQGRFDPVVVRVSGFGTYDDATADRLSTSKRLIARRASQLDAYRNLAERVYGTVIYGSSTVSDFVARNDMFRSYVDTYLRGAKVVSVIEHSDGVVETVMELKLERRFRECVAQVDERDVARACPMPLPQDNDSAGDMVSREGASSLYYLD